MSRDRWFVAAMAIVWAVAGIVEPHLPDAGEPMNATGIVQNFVLAILMFGWCKAHARNHAVSVPEGAPLLIALLVPIGLPYYAFRAFGARKGMRLLALSILSLIGFMGAYFLCFYLSARLGH